MIQQRSWPVNSRWTRGNLPEYGDKEYIDILCGEARDKGVSDGKRKEIRTLYVGTGKKKGEGTGKPAKALQLYRKYVTEAGRQL